MTAQEPAVNTKAPARAPRVFALLTALYMVTLFACALLPFASGGKSDPLSQLIHNLMHIPAFAFVCFLWIVTFYSLGIEAKFFAVILTFLFGMVVEFFQGYVPGRMPSVLDMGLDSIGIAAAVLLTDPLLERLERLKEKVLGVAGPSDKKGGGFSFFHWLKTRTEFYIENRRLPSWPWRFLWFKHFLKGFFFAPFTALKYFGALRRDEMKVDMFYLQVFGKRILRETLDACQEAGIRPFLVYGSLLGHVRENGLIPTDNDIDLGFVEEDMEKIGRLKQEMIRNGYTLRIQEYSEISFSKAGYGNQYIDFWPYYRLNEAQRYCGNVFTADPDKAAVFVYPQDLFTDLVPTRFLGCDVWLPRDAEEYLRVTYGDDWRCPLLESDSRRPHGERQRIMHPNIRLVDRALFASGALKEGDL